jgi:D-alanyl-lipoteichoic acid biosynthesis protein DltD
MGHASQNHRVHGAEAAGRVNAPHLLPALAAVLLLAGAVVAGYRHARRVERQSIHGLSTALVTDLAQRRALQVEACRQHDLLLVYGSSEVLMGDPYHVIALLHDYPTGFTAVPVGQWAGCSALYVQHLAALGPALHGRKVVVSYTPTTFYPSAKADAAAYGGNFSRVSANEVAFSTCLSLGVKQALARRMAEHPRTLEPDPLLEFAVRQLADGSTSGRALYYAALPLGRLQVGLLRLQDHWTERGYLEGRALPPDPRQHREAPRRSIDWAALAERAEREYWGHANNNPFGFDNRVWLEQLHGRGPEDLDGCNDARMRHSLETTTEWDDLDNLLQVLHELGAEPLLVTAPLKGGYLDQAHIRRETRRYYHERLRAVARAHGVPLVDFAGHDQDAAFLFDRSHFSSKGWVYYAYTLDAFFHGRPSLELSPGTAGGGAMMTRR